MKAVVNKSKLDALYSVMNKRYRKLGGNATGGAIYGEVTAASFSKIVGNFKEFCELSENSTFGEFGSGLGKPNQHMAASGVLASIGFEAVGQRWWQSGMHTCHAWWSDGLYIMSCTNGCFDVIVNSMSIFISESISSFRICY